MSEIGEDEAEERVTYLSYSPPEWPYGSVPPFKKMLCATDGRRMEALRRHSDNIVSALGGGLSVRERQVKARGSISTCSIMEPVTSAQRKTFCFTNEVLLQLYRMYNMRTLRAVLYNHITVAWVTQLNGGQQSYIIPPTSFTTIHEQSRQSRMAILAKINQEYDIIIAGGAYFYSTSLLSEPNI